MISLYTAVCMQSNRRTINHKKEIREVNLEPALRTLDYAVDRVGFHDYAPTKLVLFPEVFMQGWPREPGRNSYMEERGREVAIEIPGEETNIIAERAKAYNIYIAGTAHEVMPEFGYDYVFNCAFIINPKGEICYKYHKYNPHPWMNYKNPVRSGPDDVSPHDVFDKYVQVMDGKYGRKKGNLLSCFFPVIDTDLGKIGYIICNDGFFPEPPRALATQGCEVMLRSNGILVPLGLPPFDADEMRIRASAVYNMMYVVQTQSGELLDVFRPSNVAPGHSMIVDFHGAILCHANHQGEGVTGAVINIEALRARRMDPKENYLTQLRTEIYREIYAKSIYPKNLFLKKKPTNFAERMKEQPIEKFIDEGIFTRPEIPLFPS